MSRDCRRINCTESTTHCTESRFWVHTTPKTHTEHYNAITCPHETRMATQKERWCQEDLIDVSHPLESTLLSPKSHTEIGSTSATPEPTRGKQTDGLELTAADII